ncbi:MAG: hypothetical protein DHS20C12_22920 [Pseudohongiella sp.]|nr:MAG: hypothetical protein DHS20C12_22920 [Pseudohongiella sp.]
MKIRTLLSLCAASIGLFSLPAIAVEDVVVDYEMTGSPRSDLSSMKVSLRIAEFTDSRSTDNPRLITGAQLLGADGFQAEKAMGEIIQDAMVSGFANANAQLVDADGDMFLQGDLTASDAKIIDRAGVETLELTLRVSVQLMSGSRTVWQTNLFGRGRTPTSEGMAVNVRAALDRLINELIGDDYFLAEIR